MFLNYLYFNKAPIQIPVFAYGYAKIVPNTSTDIFDTTGLTFFQLINEDFCISNIFFLQFLHPNRHKDLPHKDDLFGVC